MTNQPHDITEKLKCNEATTNINKIFILLLRNIPEEKNNFRKNILDKFIKKRVTGMC